jgi:hypothetical protein
MTYTVTCPDPECKTTFELDAKTFDIAYAKDEPISCPGVCGLDYEWDYDPTKADGEDVTLAEAVEYEEPDALDELGDANLEDVDDDEEDDPDEE